MKMKKFQKINHFPGMVEIARKDRLAVNLGMMLKVFPKEYSFFPLTFRLPQVDLGAVLYCHLLTLPLHS